MDTESRYENLRRLSSCGYGIEIYEAATGKSKDNVILDNEIKTCRRTHIYMISCAILCQDP